MGGGRETRENTLLGKEEGTGADGEEGAPVNSFILAYIWVRCLVLFLVLYNYGRDDVLCSLARRILLLDLTVGSDEVERLGLGLDDGFSIATNNNDNVEVLQALMGLLEGDLGTDDDTGIAKNLRLSGSNGNVEGLGGYSKSTA